MQVSVGLIMLAAYFCYFRLSQVEYNCGALIKVDWLAASCLYCTKSCWHFFGRFPLALAQNLHNPPASGKQGPITEEMSQILLTKKSKET
jgi:hypothetical protein